MIWVLNLQRSDESKIELTSLRDLGRIDEEARNFEIDLIVIGGYAVRAYTTPRSWRFTKDMDFVTTRRDLTALRGVFGLLKYGFEQTEYGVKGSKKINSASIELHISVDKVIDWSTGLEYQLPEDIFSKASDVKVKAGLEENKGLEVGVKVAPIEDVVIMKLITERPRDHFDAVAMIIDSFEKMDVARFWANSEQSGLTEHMRRRLRSLLADLRKSLVKKLWREFTEREFIREQEVTLRERIKRLFDG